MDLKLIMFNVLLLSFLTALEFWDAFSSRYAKAATKSSSSWWEPPWPSRPGVYVYAPTGWNDVVTRG